MVSRTPGGNQGIPQQPLRPAGRPRSGALHRGDKRAQVISKNSLEARARAKPMPQPPAAKTLENSPKSVRQTAAQTTKAAHRNFGTPIETAIIDWNISSNIEVLNNNLDEMIRGQEGKKFTDDDAQSLFELTQDRTIQNSPETSRKIWSLLEQHSPPASPAKSSPSASQAKNSPAGEVYYEELPDTAADANAIHKFDNPKTRLAERLAEATTEEKTEAEVDRLIEKMKNTQYLGKGRPDSIKEFIRNCDHTMPLVRLLSATEPDGPVGKQYSVSIGDTPVKDTYYPQLQSIRATLEKRLNELNQ